VHASTTTKLFTLQCVRAVVVCTCWLLRMLTFSWASSKLKSKPKKLNISLPERQNHQFRYIMTIFFSTHYWINFKKIMNLSGYQTSIFHHNHSVKAPEWKNSYHIKRNTLKRKLTFLKIYIFSCRKKKTGGKKTKQKTKIYYL